jgi:lipoprotein-releasing system permease protein
MIQPFEWMIALRYLRAKRRESFISIVSWFSLIGIALGVATLIIVMSVMNGYHVELLKRILGINGHISVTLEKGKIVNYEDYVLKIGKIDNVTYSAPLVLSQAMVIANKNSMGVMVRGMDAESLEHKPVMRDTLDHSSLEKFKKGEGLYLGISLARQLNVETGDTIKLITPETTSTLIGSIPRMKTYQVIGTFDVGMYEYNATTIFMPLEEAQLFFKYNQSVSDIEVMVTNPEKMDDIKQKITDLFENQNVRMVDWGMANSTLFNALAVERNVMFLILTLIILVAAFNIISSLIMLVKDKATNIAILRTIGASKNSIIKIFVICGSMIGIIGTIMGGLIGVTFALNIERIRQFLQSMTGFTLFDPVIYFLTQLPSHLEFTSVFTVCFISLIFSLLATIYPAWRASKLTPAEVLRYE